MQTKRQSQIGELIKRNFGPVLQEQGSYIYGGAFVTVTNVIMSPDLALAKIYVSIYNTDSKETVLTQIRESKHGLKNALVRRIRRHVRRIPDIDFYLDEMVDEMYRVNALFDKLHEEKQMGEEE